MRKVLYYLGLVVLALVTFVFAVQATFPYDRVKAKIEEAASAKVDLTIGGIERGIMPGVFYLTDVTMKTRPSQAELDKAYAITDLKERDKTLAGLVSTIYVERLRVSVGLLGAIGGKASIDFDAKFGAGSIHGNATISKDSTTVRIEGDDVPSDQLPMREVLSNLPMSGDIQFEFELELPNDKLKTGKVGPNWPKAVGALEFNCAAGCIIGDGKSKLKLKAKNERSQKFAGEGTDFGKLRLESLVAKAELKDGKLDITKFEVSSSDVQLFVDFTMTMAQDINDSVVMGCLRFKGTEALRKREPRTFDQISLTGAARHTDGMDHIRLKGNFKELKKLPEVCGPGISAQNIDAPGSGGTPSRPNLVVQPDEPTKPAGSAATPTFTPPTPPVVDAGVAAADGNVGAAGAAPPNAGSAGDRSGEHAPPAGSGSDHGSGSAAEGSAGPNAGHER